MSKQRLSFGEAFDNFGDDLLVGFVGAVDGELGVPAVEGLALVVERA